jgi:nucleoside-triphosphatase
MTTILITGNPGVGKTTCIREIAQSLGIHHPIGFYTEEVREQGTRVGFELVGLDGRRLLLAHTGISSRYRVGKYRVDISAFEEFLTSFTIPEGKDSVIILDEIGKMECFSPVFRELVVRLLDRDCLLIATIAKKGGRFIEEIKGRGDIVLFKVTNENREQLAIQVLEEVTTLLKKTGKEEKMIKGS